MKAVTYEGIVQCGRIKLCDNVQLPENTRVYVIIADEPSRVLHFMSPKLVNPQDAAQFKKIVTRL